MMLSFSDLFTQCDNVGPFYLATTNKFYLKPFPMVMLLYLFRDIMLRNIGILGIEHFYLSDRAKRLGSGISTQNMLYPTFSTTQDT